MNPPAFTPQQLADWLKYERVRKSGRFNMLFPEALQATGLSEDRYTFVLQNFVALRDAQTKRIEPAVFREIVKLDGSAHYEVETFNGEMLYAGDNRAKARRVFLAHRRLLKANQKREGGK